MDREYNVYRELEWNVYREDVNHKCFYKYNIFSHGGFVKSLKEMINKRNQNVDQDFDFNEELKRILKYYFWAKCEMELLLTDWPNQSFTEKVDVYDQLELNWNRFVDYIYSNMSNIIRDE